MRTSGGDTAADKRPRQPSSGSAPGRKSTTSEECRGAALGTGVGLCAIDLEQVAPTLYQEHMDQRG